jgi:hypothetical protein
LLQTTEHRGHDPDFENANANTIAKVNVNVWYNVIVKYDKLITMKRSPPGAEVVTSPLGTHAHT